MSMNIPDACTLPTAERPLRLAEFDELFATAVRRVEPLTATHARLHLTGPADLADRVRDLTARETECCSFFTFTVTPDGDAVRLDVEVPAAYAEVLTSLTDRARLPGELAARPTNAACRKRRHDSANGKHRRARLPKTSPGHAGRPACLPALDNTQR